MSEIATSTLRFYRDPAGSAASDLAELAGTVLKLFRARIATSQVSVESLLPRGALVSGPQGELRQFLANLVGNALDAMPTGGCLILRIRRFANQHTGKSCVRLTMADSGVGMEADVLSRIFHGVLYNEGNLRKWAWALAQHRNHKEMRIVDAIKSANLKGTVFRLSFEK